MPAYSNSAFAPLPEVSMPGKPSYFFGSLPTDTQDTLARVTNVAITSNVATVTATIYAGSIPVAGNFISIIGSPTASGAFNVSQVALSTVSVVAATGVATLTFPLTHADVGSVASSGMVYIPIAETTEACANGTSVAIYVPSNELNDFGAKSITVATTFPSLPTAATVTLYAAINNNPQAAASEWTAIGPVAVVAGGVQTAGPLQSFTSPSMLAGRFYRAVISGVSGGTSPTICCKMIP